MNQKKLFKIVFILLLAISAFHLSGIETALCADCCIPEKASSPDCSVCQPGNQLANIAHPVITFTETMVSIFSMKNCTFRVEEPTRYIFRPPISL